jgi:D-arabinose 5-phosphate isomerase GutQ
MAAQMSEQDTQMSTIQEAMDAAIELLAAETRAVGSIANLLDGDFVHAVELLRACAGKVIVSGVGTSGTVARRLAHLLSVSGTPALFLHPADALHGSLGAITEADVLIVISKGGGSGEVNEFATRARQLGASVLALTCTPDSSLAAGATHAVVLPVEEAGEPGGMIAMSSTLATSAWGDALALVLMRLRSYGFDRVLFTHPGGAVGLRGAEFAVDED